MPECSFSSAKVQWNVAPDRFDGPEFWEVDDVSLAALEHMTNFRAAWENVRAVVWSPRADLKKHVLVLSPTIAPLEAPRGAGIALLDRSWGWGAPVEVLRPTNREWALRVMRGRPHCCLQYPMVLRHLLPPGGAIRAVHVPQEPVPNLTGLQAEYPVHVPTEPAEEIAGVLSDRLTPIGALMGAPTHILWGYSDGTPCGWEEVDSVGSITARWTPRGEGGLVGVAGAGVQEFPFTPPDYLDTVHEFATFHADSVAKASTRGLASV